MNNGPYGVMQYLVYGGSIHCMGGHDLNSYEYYYDHSTLSPTLQRTKFNKLPCTFSRSNGAVVYNDELHIISNNNGNHYKWNSDSDTWTLLSALPYTNDSASAIVHNGILNVFAFGTFDRDGHYQFQAPNKVYDPNTLILYKGDQHNGTYLTAIADTSMITDDGKNNNRFISGFDDVVYFADSSFDWGAPMYYGNGSQWIKFKN